MVINFKELIIHLKQKLAEDLPGIKAHKLMMPEGRKFHPDKSTTPIESAVLIVLYEDKNQILFPIIKRPIYNGLHSGQMALPGGKFEKSDVDLIDTALRETEEEIGIISKDITILGTLSQLYIPITNIKVLPVLGYLNTPPNYLLNNHEVDALFKVNISDLLNPLTKNNETRKLRGDFLEIPFYNLHSQKVWGATAMMLSEFEQIVKDCI